MAAVSGTSAMVARGVVRHTWVLTGTAPGRSPDDRAMYESDLSPADGGVSPTWLTGIITAELTRR